MTRTATVRAFAEEDRTALRGLFGGRAGAGSPVASLFGHEEAEAAIYLTPYMDREPESLFVAVADGRIVGYLAGCLDSEAFPAESARIYDAIRRYRVLLRPRAAAFFLRAGADMGQARLRRRTLAGDFADPRWPAHLHIAVLPEARGTGAAHALMNGWIDRLRQTGTPGCYLQTQVENTRAVRFFERMGFRRHGPTPLMAGMRYEGRHLHQQTMVRP